MLKRIHRFKKKTNKFNKKKEKNYPYTKSILSSLFPPVLYTNNFTSNACFCIGDAINPGQRFKTRLPLSSDLKTVYVPEASRRSVSVVDRPDHPPFPLADCFWQQIIDLFIFSFCPRSPISSSPLPPLFFQTIGNVAWRIDVARKGLSAGRKGRRTSFRERYAGGTIIGYPRLTNCTVNRPRFNEALSSSLLACRMENEKRNYPLVPDELPSSLDR